LRYIVCPQSFARAATALCRALATSNRALDGCCPGWLKTVIVRWFAPVADGSPGPELAFRLSLLGCNWGLIVTPVGVQTSTHVNAASPHTKTKKEEF